MFDCQESRDCWEPVNRIFNELASECLPEQCKLIKADRVRSTRYKNEQIFVHECTHMRKQGWYRGIGSQSLFIP